MSEERRIGELATATGLTVRTLHHYEEIGLLVASGRNSAGHRVYSDEDVRRLYRICLLRRIGLPLAEIGRALDDPAWDLRGSMAAHLTELERRLEGEQRLRGRLAHLEFGRGGRERDHERPTHRAGGDGHAGHERATPDLDPRLC